MKIYHHLLLLTALFAVNSVAFAQPSSGNRIVLKNGTFVPQKLTQTQLDLTLTHAVKTDGQRFAIISFDKKLSSGQNASLKSEGILLLDYLSAGNYIVSITKELSLQRLRKMAVTAVSAIETHYKIAPQLLLSNQANEVEVLIAFHRSVNSDTVISSLVRNGYTIGKPDLLRYNMLIVSVPAGKLFSLASMPFVAVVEKAPPPIEPLNHNSRNLSMAGVAQSSLPGGYNLSGEGVLVGIAEPSSSIPYLHQDYAARIQEGPTGVTTSQHASHVLGTLAGAGNIQERYKGYVPKASIVTTSGQFQFSNSSDFFSLMQQKMVVSNNSYAVGGPCQSGYPAGTGFYDKTVLDYPKFLEVFGAGNFGQTNCAGSIYYSSVYSDGFNTVATYANSAKNTLSVGAVYSDGLVHPGSSRGPASDGRLKPDITAMGINVASTIYETGYGLNTGTSMATPAVTGTIALLNEYYRRLHKDELPNSSLLKAVVCNSATDYGNRGPDFLYGYGILNVIRAVRTLENQWHREDSVMEMQEKTISVPVTAGTAQLKVMLYWHDRVMAPLASRALVNDLDISVTAPGGAVVLPYILDTDPAHAGAPATRGVDRLNNMEQVVIDDPVAGNYTIRVRGTELGMGGNQPFAVVYDLVKDEVEIAYPVNGDNIQPGETFYIQWHDKVQNTSMYTVEYSLDAGVSWQLISNVVPATQRRLQWVAPGIANDNAQVRVRRNEGGTAGSSSFVLLGTPGAATSAIQCPSYFNLRWGQVPGATDYEIFLLRNGQMQSQGTTTLLQYALAGLSPDTTYYAAVAARINGKRSFRSTAVSRMPNTGNCAGDFSDGDMSVDSLFLPVFAREGTSSAYSSQQQLKVRIRNFDDQPSGAYTIRYRVNNSAWITEQYSGPVSGNSSAILTLSTPFDLSAIGAHDVIIAITNADDRNQHNDTLTRKLRQLENSPISISPAFVDSFARSEKRLYNASRLALDGMERYDYFSEHFAGRLSTGTSGLFASDRKEIYLTTQTSDQPSTAKFHRVIGTFNLSDYDTLHHDIGLTITYSKMTSPLGQEKLFVRGSDTSSWIEAYLFFSVAPSLNNKTVSLNLTDILRKGKQNFSSSAQLMISQQLYVIRFSVSAFRLFDASNDAELITADSLQSRSYPGSVKPLHVIVRNNSRNVMNNVPVAFRVNNANPVIEVIPSIAPSSAITYKFTTPV
ncbi:MAG: S8 family serine peptidase, partial [Chitinophagaceae bacterium]|nr:S8 family serine peptidase [Chitinophagaceae bacterium]